MQFLDPFVRLLRVTIISLTGMLLLVAGNTAARADSDALWKIVHGKCVPDQQVHGIPAPCALVSTSGGYAILKDLHGFAQFLLIPTEKITGIDDPKILAPDTPNYFAEAWDNRRFTEGKLPGIVPREAIALSINSAYGRSQNQLHIHIDCLRADVAEALKAHEREITSIWAPLAVPLAGHTYQVRRVETEALDAVNPFALVAAESPAIAHDMARETIVVAGARFADGHDGFYILTDRANLLALDRASGEELQDQSCGIVRKR